MQPVANHDWRGPRIPSSKTALDLADRRIEDRRDAPAREQNSDYAAHPRLSHKSHLQKHGERLSAHSHQTHRVRSRLLLRRQDSISEALWEDSSSTTSTDPETAVATSTAFVTATTLWTSTTPYGSYSTSETLSSATTSQSGASVSADLGSTSPTMSTFSTSIIPSGSSNASSVSPTPTRYPHVGFNGTSVQASRSQTSSTSSSEGPLIPVILSAASWGATASNHLTSTALTLVLNTTSTPTSSSSETLAVTSTSCDPAASLPLCSATLSTSSFSTSLSEPVSGTGFTTFSSSATFGAPRSSGSFLPTIASSSLSTSSERPLQSTNPSSQVSSSFATSLSNSLIQPSSSTTQIISTSRSSTHQHSSTMNYSHTLRSSTRTATSSSISASSSATGIITAAASRTPTSTVVGSVVGGLAGLSVLLLLLLVLLRWWKRRHYGSTRPLDGAGPMTADTSTPGISSAGAFLPAAAAGLMNRLSLGSFTGRPLSVAPAVAPTEQRGFERIAGRKLPSQFSPGMEGPTMREFGAGSGIGPAYASGSSAYPSGGTFASENPFADPVPLGAAGVAGAAAGDTRRNGEAGMERETFMPSPARTPVLHSSEGRNSFLAAPSTAMPGRPLTPGRGAGTTSLPGSGSPSRPGTRGSVGTAGSRFKEEIL